MANKGLINRYKYMYQQTQQITPAIYASIAIALHEEGWGFKRINRVFARSQEIWQNHDGSNDDMLKKCEELTGIEMRGAK